MSFFNFIFPFFAFSCCLLKPIGGNATKIVEQVKLYSDATKDKIMNSNEINLGLFILRNFNNNNHKFYSLIQSSSSSCSFNVRFQEAGFHFRESPFVFFCHVGFSSFQNIP